MSTPAKEVSILNICGSNYGQIQKIKFNKCNVRVLEMVLVTMIKRNVRVLGKVLVIMIKCNVMVLGMVLVTMIKLQESITVDTIYRNCVDGVKTIDYKLMYLNLFAENYKRLSEKQSLRVDTPIKRIQPHNLQSCLIESIIKSI